MNIKTLCIASQSEFQMGWICSGRASNRKGGFALVATLSMMALLVVLCIGMLGTTSTALRNNSVNKPQERAQANARMALMIALGELQESMGPDMRVSMTSALLDQNEATEEIDGVAQSHWLGVYDSWGDWLNTSYTPPGKSTLRIGDTYTKGREQMFRRWLLSLPDGMDVSLTAPTTPIAANDENWVTLVGSGTLGNVDESDLTKAYLTQVDDNVRVAWWIGPENQKAKIPLAHQPRSLSADEWEIAAGSTSEVGISSMLGLEAVDDHGEDMRKIISQNSLELVQDINASDARRLFHDLTAHSEGVLASVRAGHLKKDLSLLFEKSNAALPAPYRFNAGTDIQEPSIRPMSSDLLANNPAIPGRHFQSWTNMRHFYRMYRSDSDATVKSYGGAYTNNGGGINGPGHLRWTSNDVYTDVVSNCNITYADRYDRWPGFNNYRRVPVLTKLTYIFSTITKPNPDSPGRYICQVAHTPVLTYWNPYNITLRIPPRSLGVSLGAYDTWPMGAERYIRNTYLRTQNLNDTLGRALLDTEDGSDIVFKPGEFIQFCPQQVGADSFSERIYLYPGFNPQAYGGLTTDIELGANPTDNRGFAMIFNSVSAFLNINDGNTAGSLTFPHYWSMDYFTSPHGTAMPGAYQNDWFNVSQQLTPITPAPRGPYSQGNTVTNPEYIIRWNYSDPNITPFAYAQMVLKGFSTIDYETVGWARDWRGRNWIYSPGHYFGSGLYASEDADLLHTQRLENPYVVNFGEIRGQIDLAYVVNHHPNDSSKPFLGAGTVPFEKVNRAPAIELPTAPISSLAGFSGMRINPGWTHARDNFPHLDMRTGHGTRPSWSLYAAEHKVVAYQSGVTGPGIGNSFIHPMLERDGVYRFVNNSISQDPNNNRYDWQNTEDVDTKAYCDYWDHVFLLNDALWDDYFLSSFARQGRDNDTSVTANDMIDQFIAGDPLPNSRYRFEPNGLSDSQVRSALKAADGYLKAANYMMVDGMFNVNSASVDAWHALFSGIRERSLVRRNGRSLETIDVPSNKKIGLSRFNTAVFGEEMTDVEYGIQTDDEDQAWSDVRFLSDEQLRKLAEECVKQVKLRGPFLNFSEFINRRLSNDDLGTMGALQAAIDYDDGNPDPDSINYLFKSGTDYMMDESDLGSNDFGTPEAVNGSRFAGIPGYVIQSDLLKPISNTLSVRDDTFRIRAYGEVRDDNGKVVARAWCEAIVQRSPEYMDSTNEDHEAVRTMGANGTFSNNSNITTLNQRFGRKLRLKSFRWLDSSKI